MEETTVSIIGLLIASIIMFIVCNLTKLIISTGMISIVLQVGSGILVYGIVLIILKDEYLYEDQQALYLHSDRDWDLPELIFVESDENMKNLIKDIKRDGYFRSYSGKINESIYTLEKLSNYN